MRCSNKCGVYQGFLVLHVVHLQRWRCAPLMAGDPLAVYVVCLLPGVSTSCLQWMLCTTCAMGCMQVWPCLLASK